MTTTPHSDDASKESARASAPLVEETGTPSGNTGATGTTTDGGTAVPGATPGPMGPVAGAQGHHRHDLSHMLFAHSVPGTEVKKQISYIAPGQTVKALMFAYLTFSVPLVLLALILGLVRNGGEMDVRGAFGALFGALILNGIVGFVLLWIACRAYNWVASRFGGIEITLSDPPKDV
ncbi:hypothetical protein JOE11_002712 [Robbsia andropogonis]